MDAATVFFGGSDDDTHDTYQYHYDNISFIGLKASLIIQANLKNGYAGLSVEHYIIINNHNRFDFGISVSISIGKLP
jgi:hypothetical protein